MPENNIGQTIKRLRKAAGLSQEKTAEIFGVSSQAVSKWELGQTFPDITLLRPIAEYFGVTVDSLLGGNDEGDFAEIMLIRGAGYSAASLEQRFGIFRDGLRRVPRNTSLIADAIGTGYLLVKTYLDAKDSRADAYFADTVSLCNRQLETSHDTNELTYAKFILAMLYALHGRTGEAEEIARQFPEIGANATSGVVRTAVQQTAGSAAGEIEARIENLEQMAQNFTNEITAIKRAYERLNSPQDGGEREVVMEKVRWSATTVKLNDVGRGVFVIDGDDAYYFAADDRELRHYDVKTGENRLLANIDVYILQMCVAPDGALWALAFDSEKRFSDPENKKMLLRVSGLRGNPELTVIEIPGIIKNIHTTGMKIDRYGHIYLNYDEDFMTTTQVFGLDRGETMRSEILIMAQDGSVMQRVTEERRGPLVTGHMRTVRLADGRVGYFRVEEQRLPLGDPVKFSIAPLNPFTGEWEEKIELRFQAQQLFDGYGKYAFYFSNWLGDLYGHNSETNADELIFAFLDTGVSANHVKSMCVLSGGEYRLVSAQPYVPVDATRSDYVYEISTFAVRTGEDTRTRLTLGTVYIDQMLNEIVADFNRENEEYYIDVVAYNAQQPGNFETLVGRFTHDLLGGNIPDIIGFHQQPSRYLARRMRLVDLYRCIDGDDALAGDDFILPLLKVFETDSALRFISPYFSYNLLFGKGKTAGSGYGLSFDELLALLDANPGKVAFYNYTNTAALGFLLSNCIDDFIDWRTGETRFRDGEYAKLLEICKRQPAVSPDYADGTRYYGKPLRAAIRDGDFLFEINNAMNILEFTLCRDIYGEDAAIRMMPSARGGGLAVSAGILYAISEDSEHKDAAWQLLRRIICYEGIYSSSNSILLKQHERYIEEKSTQRYITPNEYNEKQISTYKRDGEGRVFLPMMSKYSYFDDMPDGYHVYAATHGDIERVNAVIDSADRLQFSDNALLSKLKDAALPFFSGAAEAEQAAAEADAIVRAHYGFDGGA